MYWVSMARAMQNLAICASGSRAADPLRDRAKVYQFASDRVRCATAPRCFSDLPRRAALARELFRLGK